MVLAAVWEIGRRELKLDQAKAIGRALKTAQIDNSEKIWPQDNWSDMLVLLLDGRHKRTYLWNETGQIRETGFSDLPQDLKQDSGWFTGKLLGRKLLGIEAAESRYQSNDILELLCHEGFHLVGQKSWPIRDRAGWRGDDYPENWRPRYLRRQAMKALFVSFISGDDQALGKAVFWHKKYRQEFPTDYQKTRDLDRIEGSADYVGLMGATLGQLGPEVNLTSHLRGQLAERWRLKYNNLNYQGSLKEGESYCLGAIAGLILDRQKISGWKQRVAQGANQLDILAENIKEIPAPDRPADRARIKKYYDLKNEELKTGLDKYLAGWNNQDYVILVAPLDWVPGGTWNRSGFLTYDDGKGAETFIVGFSGDFVAPSGGKISFDQMLVEFIMAPYPIGLAFGYVITPVKLAGLEESGDRSFKIDLPNIKAKQARFSITQDKNGQSWYWLK